MLVLAIETATDVCSVALLRGEALLGQRASTEPRSHAAWLVPLIDELLREHDMLAAELDAVAVSAGPGSFTGLRIGASVAKGLAYAGGAALVAVPTLEALARVAHGLPPRPVLSIIPHRKGEAFATVYAPSPAPEGSSREPASVVLAELDEWLPAGSLYAVGPGARLASEHLAEPNRLSALDAEASAIRVGALGVERLRRGHVENVAAWEPYYLQSFVAGAPRPIFG